MNSSQAANFQNKRMDSLIKMSKQMVKDNAMYTLDGRDSDCQSFLRGTNNQIDYSAIMEFNNMNSPNYLDSSKSNAVDEEKA